MTEPHQSTKHTPKSGEISPKEQESEGQARIVPILGEILPKQQEETNPRPTMPSLGEIPQKKTQQVANLAGIEEETIVNLNGKNTQQGSPQVDTAEHYLDDNFSDVMQSSALGSNMSSLFNTTTFNTTHNEHKLPWTG